MESSPTRMHMEMAHARMDGVAERNAAPGDSLYPVSPLPKDRARNLVRNIGHMATTQPRRRRQMSPAREPRQARAHATRQTILTAAAEAFERRGYDGTSIADILEAADITKGALYFHFESKEDLARSVIAEQGTWLNGVRDPDCHPVQEIVQVSYRFAQALTTNALFRASIRLTIEHGSLQFDTAASYLVFIEQVRRNYERAEQMGDLQAHISPSDAAYLTVSTITGLQLVTRAVTTHADLPGHLTSAWKILLPALLTPEALPLVQPTLLR